MAQVKKGGDKPHEIKSTTIDGIQFQVKLYATTANTPIAQTDFNPEKVSVRGIIKRNGKADTQLFSTNLAILAHYSTLQRNRDKWLYGFDMISAASGVKAVKMREFKYSFNTSINLKGEDEIIITTSVPDTGAFSSAIDDVQSFIEFKEVPSVGYEKGIPQLEVASIEATTTADTINMGEDVMDIVILNFDKNDLESPVLNNANISSAYYNRNLSYMDLICNHYNLLPHNVDERYGSTIPMAAGSTTGRVFPWLTPYPQSFYLYKGRKHEQLLHVKLELTFNGENVAASKNYVVYQKLLTDGTTLRKSHAMAEKHDMETIERLDRKG